MRKYFSKFGVGIFFTLFFFAGGAFLPKAFACTDSLNYGNYLTMQLNVDWTDSTGFHSTDAYSGVASQDVKTIDVPVGTTLHLSLDANGSFYDGVTSQGTLSWPDANTYNLAYDIGGYTFTTDPIMSGDSSIIARETDSCQGGLNSVEIDIVGVPSTPPSSYVPPTLDVDFQSGGGPTPNNNSTVSGVFTVAGWALDNNTSPSSVSTPITSLTYSIDGGPAQSGGYGTARPDVCGIYPNAAPCSSGNTNIGYSFPVNAGSLTPGNHTITLTAIDGAPSGYNTASQSFYVNVVPLPAPIVYVDTPGSGSTVTGPSVKFSGWAIDQANAISKVTVSVDGNPAQIASYGVNRPDVCFAYPGYSGCPAANVGYSLVTSLSPGSHTAVITAWNSDSPTPQSSSQTVSFTVAAAAPQGSFTPPANCSGPYGSTCSTAISWTTTNVTKTELVVTGGSSNDVTNLAAAGSWTDSFVPIPGFDTYTLYDYSSGSRGALLAGPVNASGVPYPVDGACATPPNANNYSSVPAGPYCSAGTFSGISGSGPWTWTCSGKYGGIDASCSAGTTSGGSCSLSTQTISAAANQGDPSQTQTVTVTNTSPSAVTATVSDPNLPSWLTITPSSVPSIPSSGGVGFTLTLTAGSSLPTGHYTYSFNINLSGGTTPSCNQSNNASTQVNVSFVVSSGGASPTVTSVTLTPTSASLIPGNVAHFIATAHYSDGTSLNITSIAPWTSSDPSVTSNGGGAFTAVSVGAATVSACSPSDTTKCGSASITVNAPVTLSLVVLPSATVWVGSTINVTASGGTGAYPTWKVNPSGNITGQTITSSGTGTENVFSGVASTPGTTTVTAIDSAGNTGSTSVTVLAPQCSSFTASPAMIVPPSSATLSWICTNAPSCNINGTSVSATGSLQVTPTASTTYMLTCTGLGSGPFNTTVLTAPVKVVGSSIIETHP